MRRTAVRLAAMVLTGWLLAACGAGRTGPRMGGFASELQPIWCPSAPPYPASGQTVRERGSFDVRTLLGLTERRARAITAAHGCSLRIVNVNGRGQLLTLQLSADRVDIDLSRGIVTQARVY